MITSLAVVLLLTLLAAPALAAFPDVPQGHEYYTAIEGMAARQIIGGYSNGRFGPDDPVKRAQFAKMIDGTMALQVTEGGLELPPFTDMGSNNDPTSLYPHDYVAAAFWANITTGKTATTFAPWDPITRAQMITMAVRAANSLEPGALDPVPAGFQPTIPFFSDIHSPTMNQAEANGLLAGLFGFSGAWNPNDTATRGECAQVLWNLLGKMQEPTTISRITPSSGPIAGAQDVTIIGTGFVTGATVAFAGTPATNVTVVNAGTITAKTPAHVAGTVDVKVTTVYGASNGIPYSYVESPPADGLLPTFDELKPTAPIGYSFSFELSKASLSFANAMGIGRSIRIEDTAVSAHATIQVVSVTDGVATLRLAVDELTLPDSLSTMELEDSLPFVLTVQVAKNGEVRSASYSTKSGPDTPLASATLAQLTPFLAQVTQVFLLPYTGKLEDVGDVAEIITSYTGEQGQKTLELTTSVTLEGVEGKVATLSYEMNAGKIDTTVSLDVMPLISELLGTEPQPGAVAMVVLKITGSIVSSGRLDVDTETGLPVAQTGSSSLRLNAVPLSLPQELVNSVPLLSQLAIAALNADLDADMARE